MLEQIKPKQPSNMGKQLLCFDSITTFMEFIVAFHKYDLRCSQEGLEQITWL